MTLLKNIHVTKSDPNFEFTPPLKKYYLQVIHAPQNPIVTSH